jgi:hypothetical protein
MRDWVCAGLLVMCVGCGQVGPSGGAAAPGERGGSAAAEVSLAVLDFQQLQALIARHKDKIVVVDCWSTT